MKVRCRRFNQSVVRRVLLSSKHLREMNNFNSYLAILSAFDAAAISRLEWSDEVDKVEGRGFIFGFL